MTALLTLLVLLGAPDPDPVDHERIRSHLELVENLLRATPPPPEERLAEARGRNLDALHDYWRRGQYPVNTTVPGGRNPIFVDENGTACAAGALIIASGHAPLAARIAKTMNARYLDQMHDAELDDWVSNSGLSLGELRLIQPAYAYRRRFDDDFLEAAWVLDAKNVKALAAGASSARLNRALSTAVVAAAAAARDDFGGPSNPDFHSDGVEVVDLLLNRGADPNAVPQTGDHRLTSLARLRLQTTGAPKIEALLVAHGAKLTDTEAVLDAVNRFDCEQLPGLLAKPGVHLDPEHQPHPMTVYFGTGRTLPRACALTLLNSPKVTWPLSRTNPSWFSTLASEPEYVAILVKNGLRVQTPFDFMGAFELWQQLRQNPSEEHEAWAATIRSALGATKVMLPKSGLSCPSAVRRAAVSGDFEAVELYAAHQGDFTGCDLRLSPRLVNRTQRFSPGELATTRFLLRRKLVTPYDDWQSVAPLPWAASVGDLELGRMLLEADPTLVDAAPSYGCTPLAIAASRDDEAFVSLLVSYKADVTKPFAPTAKCGWPNKVGKYSNEMTTVSEVKLSDPMRAKLKLPKPRTLPESHVDPTPTPDVRPPPPKWVPGEFGG